MKLGLGTAQFGLDYGISNECGKVPLEKVKSILKCAYDNGIRVLDTAHIYGSSQEVLGNSIGDSFNFKIITKTPMFSGLITKKDVEHLERSFHSSLLKLQRKSVYGLLVHTSPDLMKESVALLFEKMMQFKKCGLVKKIGVSVYNPEQANYFTNTFEIDLIQCALNVFDQRFLLSGMLNKLQKKGIEVHIRSVFLQGLLLMDVDQLHLFFDEQKVLFKKYQDFLKQQKISRLKGALDFVESIEGVDCVLVGVCSVFQLQEILGAVGSTRKAFDFTQFACTDERVINPYNWKLS